MKHQIVLTLGEDIDARIRNALAHYWDAKSAAKEKNEQSNAVDVGNRATVTANQHMKGFAQLITHVAELNGLGALPNPRKNKSRVLPGYFRFSKDWDIIFRDGEELLGVIEMKSQSSSVGNNINSRIEEFLGTGIDFNTSFREQLIPASGRIPFRGLFLHVDDQPAIHTTVNSRKPLYAADAAFNGASYIERYAIGLRRMIEQNIYNSACLFSSTAESVAAGTYRTYDDDLSIQTFLYELAFHVAGAVHRRGVVVRRDS